MTNTTSIIRTGDKNACDLKRNDRIMVDGETREVLHVDLTQRGTTVDTDWIFVYYQRPDESQRSGYVRGSVGMPRYKRTDVYKIPYVGMPATIHLYTDSVAAVVTKINPKSLGIARVATKDEHDSLAHDQVPGLPVRVAEGILSEIIGTTERYPVSANGRIGDGSIRASIGFSRSLTDYRH